MAIYGIGIDLVEISRIKKILDKDAQSLFRKKVFAKSEIDYCEKSVTKAERYGVRFAAKEAFIKATGLTNLQLNEIIVNKKQTGKPYLTFSYALNKKLKKIGNLQFHLSLSHTKTSASAVVVAEKMNQT